MRRHKPSHGVGRELPQHPGWRRGLLIEAQFHPHRERVVGDSRVGAPVTYKVVKNGGH